MPAPGCGRHQAGREGWQVAQRQFPAGTRVVDLDLSGVRLHELSLAGAKVSDADLVGAQICEDIVGRTVNGV